MIYDLILGIGAVIVGLGIPCAVLIRFGRQGGRG